jgi:hypothetical protein
MHQDAINSDHRVYLSVSYDYQAKLPLFRWTELTRVSL